ncbi:hypothetical protein NXS15_01185 [Mycoplasma sp. CSL7475-4]|uniref:hypothetical protein n=1 Tax=Mycoplasma sp. CSL7475-4 TaxID=2973942 RepID=UPI00216B52DA|nr:hypothetical protein [Mycoplasma sp. CSL7475-4]MCS4536744.1 hypothetical protein [Mycoplasma sp. CSL7475-4]
METRITSTADQLGELITQNGKKQESKSAQQDKKIDKNVQSINNLTMQSVNLSEQIKQNQQNNDTKHSELINSINSNGAEITKLKTSKTQIMTSLDALNSTTSTLNTKTQELQNSIRLNNSEIQNVKALQSTQADKQQEIVKKLASVESLNIDQTQSIDALKLSLQANTEADNETLNRFNQLSSEYIRKNAEYSGDIAKLKEQVLTFATLEKFSELQNNTSQELQTQAQTLENTKATTLTNNAKVVALEHRMDELNIPVIPDDNLTETNLNANARILSGLSLTPGNGSVDSTLLFSKGSQNYELVNNGTTFAIKNKTNGKNVVTFANDSTALFFNDLNFQNHRAINLETPVNKSDAANKDYVDNKFNSLELSNYATISQLENKANVSDLNNKVNRNELDTYATKDDLNQKASQQDIAAYVNEHKSEIRGYDKWSEWSNSSITIDTLRNNSNLASNYYDFKNTQKNRSIRLGDADGSVYMGFQDWKLNKHVEVLKINQEGDLLSGAIKSYIDGEINKLKQRRIGYEFRKVAEKNVANPRYDQTITALSTMKVNTLYQIALTLTINGNETRYQFSQIINDDVDNKNIVTISAPKTGASGSSSSFSSQLSLAHFYFSDGQIALKWLGGIYDNENHFNVANINVKIYEMVIS